MGHGFVDSINPLNKKNAYDIGYSTANLAVTVIPVVGEAGALNDLRLGLKAATVSRDAAEAGLKAAETVPEQAAAAARLRADEERVAQVKSALKDHLPGAGARKMAAKAKAAGAKAKDRRAGGAEPSVRPLAPRTPEQVAAAEQKFNSQKQGALEEARHRQWNQRQPALAGGRSHSAGVARPSEAPGGNSTAAIGKPSVMKTVSHGPGHTPVPTGRVAAPGGRMADYKKYKFNADVPAHYSSDPRFQSLATDPAHGNKPPLPSGRQEAMAGLEAEHQKLIPGPIRRGPGDIEFYDGKGHPWDVKTPPSPMPGAPWSFDATGTAASIKKELSGKGSPPGTYPNGNTAVPEPRQIILDSSYMNTADHAALWKELDSTLNQNELQRIVEVNTR